MILSHVPLPIGLELRFKIGTADGSRTRTSSCKLHIESVVTYH
jgi:hypothetical protein